MDEIEAKALINKEKNKVLYVECNADLVDVLFGFLAMPMGAIIKLIKNPPSTGTIGSMNNLYNSVEFLDEKHFRTKQCKAMLLSPRSNVEPELRRIAGNRQDEFFMCRIHSCSNNLLSYYKDAYCLCGQIMDRPWIMNSGSFDREIEDEDGEVFVKGSTRFLISDELQVLPLSTATSVSLLSKQGVKDASGTEEKNFSIRKNEMSILLKNLFVSKAPLTEILLKNCNVKWTNGTSLKKREMLTRTHKKIKIEASSGGCDRKIKIEASSGGCDRKIKIEPCSPGECDRKIKIEPSSTRRGSDANIRVKLIVSRSNQVVYYAEANEDFIDLLFSFLTIPLGHAAKAMRGYYSKRCVHNLYQSLDAMVHLISEEVKQFLLFPTIPMYFGIQKQLLSVEEDGLEYFDTKEDGSTTTPTIDRVILDPKLTTEKKKKETAESSSGAGGFLKGSKVFTVTDKLVILPISPLSGFSILKEFNMPFSDIEELNVVVGKDDAARLLLASLISNSPLTDVFIRKVPKPEL